MSKIKLKSIKTPQINADHLKTKVEEELIGLYSWKGH